MTVENIWKDFRYAVRSLCQSPQFTISVVLVLGVGISIASAMLSMANAYRFRSAPVKDGDDLIVLASQRPTQQNLSNISYPNFKDIRDRNSAFEKLVGYAPVQIRIRSDRFSDRMNAQLVTGDFFKALGVGPSLGRVLEAQDDTAQADPLVVISRHMWQTMLASDNKVLGERLYINGSAFTVGGVAEQEFRGTDPLFHADLWLPLAKAAMIGRGDVEDRGADSLRVLGRLRQGVSLSEAHANLAVLTAQLRAEYPLENRELKTTVLWEKKARPEVGFAKQFSLSLIFVIATQVIALAMTCLNVSSLMLARALARQRELAVRMALGATPSRMFRQILFESLLLATVAGGIGMIAAIGATNFLRQLRIPGVAALYMDWRPDLTIYIVTSLLSFAVAAVVSIAPALAVARTDVQRWMHGGGYGASASKRVSKLRYRVVASQFTSVAMALMTAGVMRQTAEPRPADLGFESRDRLVLRISTADESLNAAESRQLIDRFLVQVRSTPGVVAADVAEDVRLSFDRMSMEIVPQGRTEDFLPEVSYNVVGRDYFRTMGISLLQGRRFNQFDTEGTTPVAIVNQALASRLWPRQNPIGKRFSTDQGGRKVDYEVVGVEKTGLYYGLNETPREFFYLAYSQAYRPNLAVIVHARNNPLAMVPAMRSALETVAPNLALYDVTTQEQAIEDGQFGPPRLAGSVMGFIGLVQFVVAGIGMYGLLSFLTRLHAREIGIRVALGSTHTGILALFVGKGAKLAARGIVQGTLMSFVVIFVMRRFLTGFQSIGLFDVASAIYVLALIAAVTAAAGYLPIRRILSDNPTAALRNE
jgi:predicted permease